MGYVGVWSAALLTAVSVAALSPRIADAPGVPFMPQGAVTQTGGKLQGAPPTPAAQPDAGATITTGSLEVIAAKPASDGFRLAQAQPNESKPVENGGTSATRATQIEPMVDPVRRVQPPTPVIKVKSDATADSSAEKASSKAKISKEAKTSDRKIKVVADKPNCDSGFKLDATGKRCLKVASNEPVRKRKSR
ncbi:MAG: hypothetical protein ABL907_17970 [Hyphomicrobium sp.]